MLIIRIGIFLCSLYVYLSSLFLHAQTMNGGLTAMFFFFFLFACTDDERGAHSDGLGQGLCFPEMHNLMHKNA